MEIPQGEYLGYCLCRLSEINASLQTRFGEEILYQSHANIVAHLIKLLVDFAVLVVEIGAELGNNRSISQCYELRVDLINVGPGNY